MPQLRFVCEINAPLERVWEFHHKMEYNPPHAFTDRQEAGPFRRWQHTHRLEALNPNQTRLCDTVEYELPLGGVGAMGERIWVRRRVEELFAYRHRRTKEVLE
ncbi:MAG TPA: hypothetical protein VKV18_15125, partial [Chthonomonas sp.]|uniref:SRPBCC family protein n=1 Tax=Chthonomonas sp. TaxID=2282153 RepID=UPI002B4ABE6F